MVVEILLFTGFYTSKKRWFFGILRTMNSMIVGSFTWFFWCLYQLYQLLLLGNSYQKVSGEKVGHQHIPTCGIKQLSHTSQCARHTLGFVKTKDPEKLVLSCQHFPVPQDVEGSLMLKHTHMTSIYHYQLILDLFLTNALIDMTNSLQRQILVPPIYEISIHWMFMSERTCWMLTSFPT